MDDTPHQPGTPLARWLDALGPVDGFDGLLARYHAEVGPVEPDALRLWLWRDAGVAVVSGTGRLVLPDEWPAAKPATH